MAWSVIGVTVLVVFHDTLLWSAPDESATAICGDNACASPEDKCNCPNDCGAPPTTEGCSIGFPPNPVDDDCDGMIDCADDDCISISSPFGSVPCASCANGACAGCERCGGCMSCPSDCGPPVTSETNCGDGMDNDCNGLADCSDPQCLSVCCPNGVCNAAENHCNCPSDCGTAPATEINCTDGRDNDCDGAVDCFDSECFSLPVCCGNGTCSPPEHSCNCPGDCGLPAGSETICNDGLDDDCDGLTDCADPTCFGQPTICGDNVCTSPPENSCNCPNDCGPSPPTEICNTSFDLDCDGMVTCNDPDCTSIFGFPCDSGCGNGFCSPCERCGPCPSCPADCGTPASTETNCADGVDNDCNGTADCSDSQCFSACCGNGTCDPAETSCNCSVDCGCRTASEINCFDGRDNDCDGTTDCSDLECQGGTETDCTNGLDDDCNGTTDCADPACCSNSTDCFGDCACCGLGGCDPQETPCTCFEDCGSPSLNETPAVTCQDSIDNDCDGRTDCYDADCYDADGDGFAAPPCGTDCDDTDGSIHPGAAELCSGGVDDDCDNTVDCLDSDCFGDSACCGDGTCDPYEWCTCPADCGTLTSEAGFCFDVSDNDCDGVFDCQDRDCCLTESSCHQSSGCGNGTCSSGENACNCQCDCGAPPASETFCTGNQDEDCDGLIDCADPDCYLPDADNDGFAGTVCGRDCDDSDPFVNPNAPELCNDGIDNDCDFTVDCADYADCVGDPACCNGNSNCETFEICTCAADCGTPPSSESGLCSDGLDNDCDGVADCDDFECCLSQPSCQVPFGCGDGSCRSDLGENQCNCQCDCGPPPATESACGNNRDDDCDGQSDCFDPDCQGIDVDGDGFSPPPCGPDCDDSDDTIHPGGTEICDDGINNDCDAYADCLDADCVGDAACEACCSSIFGNFFGCGYAQLGNCPFGGAQGSGSVCDAPVACCVFVSNPLGGGSWGCGNIPAICAGGSCHGAGSSCAALPTSEVVCDDGLDDECDGLIDCADPDCQIDADGDGVNAAPCGNDCADADPCGTEGPAEVCNDATDNDCDLMVDCDDTDCAGDAACCLVANAPVAPPSSSHAAADKNRNLTFVDANAGRQTAMRMTLVDLPTPYGTFNGTRMWVAAPEVTCENSGQKVPPPGGCSGAPGAPSRTYSRATLRCTPYYTDWSAYGEVHVHHELIVPDGLYELQALDEPCDSGIEGNYSTPLEADTAHWGDVVKDCTTRPCGGPNNIVDIVDVVAILDKFKNQITAPLKLRCDLEPATTDALINISDVTYALEAFGGSPYPFAGSFGGCP